MESGGRIGVTQSSDRGHNFTSEIQLDFYSAYCWWGLYGKRTNKI